MKKSYKNILSVFVIVAAGVFIVYGVSEIYQSRPVTISQAERLERLKQEAQSGDAEAQYQLGLKYRHGSGVEKDMAQAVSWYEKAVMQGHGKAQNNLAIAYEKGISVDKSIQKAIYLYKEAFENGFPRALNNLCDLYVQEDKLSSAFDVCLKAAQNGDGWSQNMVGVLYLEGHGIEQNYQEALGWFKKAAERKYFGAPRFNLGNLYWEGAGVKKDYFKAFEYYKKASDLGHKGAAQKLARIYSSSLEVKPDFIKAGQFLKKAEDKEYLQEMENFCLQDDRLNKDQIEACLIALATENPEVETIVASLYLSGTYFEKDDAKAAELFLSSAKKGEIKAQLVLPRLYFEGNGVQKDFIEGYAWLYVLMNSETQNEDIRKAIQAIRPVEAVFVNAFSEKEKKEAQAKAEKYLNLYKGNRNE